MGKTNEWSQMGASRDMLRGTRESIPRQRPAISTRKHRKLVVRTTADCCELEWTAFGDDTPRNVL